MSGLGDRYYVGKFGSRYAVYDLATDGRHSTHADEFDATVACAKANRNNAARRAVTPTDVADDLAALRRGAS